MTNKKLVKFIRELTKKNKKNISQKVLKVSVTVENLQSAFSHLTTLQGRFTDSPTRAKYWRRLQM